MNSLFSNFPTTVNAALNHRGLLRLDKSTPDYCQFWKILYGLVSSDISMLRARLPLLRLTARLVYSDRHLSVLM